MARTRTRSRGKEKRSRFRYRERSREDIEKRANQSIGDWDATFKGDFTTWNPDTGDHEVRVLPPTWDDPGHYGFDLWMHYQIGADKQSYPCPEKMNGDPCPICEAVVELQRAGKEELAKKIKAKRRVVVWVVDRDQEKKGPMIWSMAPGLDKDFTKHQTDRRTGEALFVDHPDEGYDLVFTREGTTKNTTKYLGAGVSRRESPLHDDPDKADKWLEFVEDNPIPDTIAYYDYDYMKRVYDAMPPEDDDDEEEAPRSRRDRKGKRRRREDEDLDDEDEDEDEAPRARRRKRSRIDDEDEDLDEDEEDESPRRGRGRRSRSSGEEDEEDEEDEEEPPKRSRKRSSRSSTRSRKSSRRERLDEDEDLDDEDEDEDEEPRRRRRRRR